MQSLGLGAHIDKTLAKHQQTHSQKVDEEQSKRAAGREERHEKAEALGGKFAETLQKVGLWSKNDQFTNSVPKELENGTVIVAHLKPFGTYEEAVNSICNLKYVNEGSVISKFGSRELTENELQETGLGGRGIALSVSIHSRDDELDIETEHQAVVGTMLDPESVLVPEHEEHHEPRYKVIGRDDPRFASILQTFEEFFSPDTGKIIDDIENVE